MGCRSQPGRPSRVTRPEARNLVLVVLDSLRYDSLSRRRRRRSRARAGRAALELRVLDRARRTTTCSWGCCPHTSPPQVYASEYYKQDFLRYYERLGVPGIEFGRLLPSLYLPTFLRNTLGYRTHARVSMPVLNPARR